MRTLLGSTAAVLFALSAGCSSTSSPAPLSAGHGRLTVDLIDAPAPAVKEIVVTINKVTAHSTSAGWVTVMDRVVTVDLLKLKTESMNLGFADLPEGKITQIRLYVDEAGPRYVTRPDGAQIDLKVPSGIQSGIKIKGPFDLAACEETAVTLDFDGKKSIWVHPNGQGDLWLLRPVIHAKSVTQAGVACGLDGGGGTGFPGEKGNGNGKGKEKGKPGDEGDGSGTSGDGGVIVEGPGLPGLGVPGAACSLGGQCLSGVCASGTCASGGPATPCNSDAQCASGVCSEGECTAGTAGGTGAACASASACFSNSCVNGVCEAGGGGAPCTAAQDCTESFVCTAGTCFPIIN